MHWTEHPKHLLQNINTYADNRAIIFDGLDFPKVFYMVMNKRYDELADHVVNINGAFQSKEEVVAILKDRTEKIPESSAA